MESEQQPSVRYLSSVFVFVFLCFVLYVVPELLVFKQYGFVPVEHIVDAGPHPSLGDILSALWADRAHVLNPMNNPLVRFFIVTMVVGIAFDQVRRHAPPKRKGPAGVRS
jgi:hypothetical protein